MQDEWKPPEGHPISVERAKELMAGELADVYRGIVSAACAPIFWHRKPGPILHNGTVTLARTPKRLLAITAAHVLRQYLDDHSKSPVQLQIMNFRFDNPEIIDISDELDLATMAVPDRLLKEAGKVLVPLENWPPRRPQEGRGIMLGGFPGEDRRETKPMVDWGLFTALGIARRVLGTQITWRVDREFGYGNLPDHHDLGGISGGPLIGWFETPAHFTHYALCGIISEAHQVLENVTAGRADCITDQGLIASYSGILSDL